MTVVETGEAVLVEGGQALVHLAVGLCNGGRRQAKQKCEEDPFHGGEAAKSARGRKPRRRAEAKGSIAPFDLSRNCARETPGVWGAAGVLLSCRLNSKNNQGRKDNE